MNYKVNIIFCLLFWTFMFLVPIAYATDYEEHWAKQEIEKLIDEEVFVISGDSFYPDADATVSQICHAFCYVLDVPNVDSTMNDLEFAKQNDLFLNYSNENACMSREEMAIIVTELLDIETDNDVSTSFIDDTQIAPWAKGSVAKLQKLEIFIGYPDVSFMPKNNITKAELAMIIDRCQNYLANEVTILNGEDISLLEIGFFKYENGNLSISPIEDSLELEVGDSVNLSVSYQGDDDWENQLYVDITGDGIIEFNKELLKIDALRVGNAIVHFGMDENEMATFEVIVRENHV